MWLNKHPSCWEAGNRAGGSQDDWVWFQVSPCMALDTRHLVAQSRRTAATGDLN